MRTTKEAVRLLSSLLPKPTLYWCQRPLQVRIGGARGDTQPGDETRYSTLLGSKYHFQTIKNFLIISASILRSQLGAEGRSTAHRRCEPNHVAVDETVSQTDDERYGLYAAVVPDANRLLRIG